MPVIESSAAQEHRVHGSVFRSYVRPGTGSTELCAWQLVLPAGLGGQAHRPSREEVLLVLTGDVRVSIDGTTTRAAPGDVVVVPAQGSFQIDGGGQDATLWVTTSVGLSARLADGTAMTPPWAL